jgi:predicted nucleic acid-binding Zn ribbon protein
LNDLSAPALTMMSKPPQKKPGRPKAMADVLAELMARRGYARQQASADYSAAWREAAGELIANHTRVGAVRRGALEVIVANSVLLQELTFQKPSILSQLGRLLPQERIGNLKFRVGPIE